MHKDRNNNSWSELKAKRHGSELNDAPTKSTHAVRDDLIVESNDSRKEKNDRATKQLEGVKNMFRDMADYDRKQNKSGQK